VIEMTKDVSCHKGKCEYTEEEYDPKSDECRGCTEAEKIEKELVKEQLE